jgi:3-hydroxyacyl-[acyl-carrier-protein] dehydratase
MTLQSLYAISDLKYSEDEFSATIAFNPEHEIFNGHFPSQPVVPGVILIHILKELCSKIVGTDVKLVKGTNIKFLNIIDPRDKTTISISGKYTGTDNDQIYMNANIRNADQVNIKFKGIFSY